MTENEDILHRHCVTTCLFSPQKVAVENLGDMAQSEYKHGSSLNTESSGSDSYRDILTSHKRDMIDKDGYLQGMQGIKMTNEAIHGRMKTLKDSVVKSEDSVKILLAEIKMLGQRVVQSHKAVQKEEEPGTFSSFFLLGLNHLWCPPWNSSPRDLQKT
ncbi:BRISC complex subunit Abraxas 2-like isoform X2 [Apostichopus japonicus]|uniref:BRISC complex subunit Abraxas 2-like isoform X2 n=1 Tax=Stichopus japonicus TaxID=307972 RepID=UPI003AB65AC7